MTKIMTAALTSVAILCLTGVLGGCSTAASMRIEVEVYKGPLARMRETQVGELNGTIAVAHTNVEAWLNQAPATDRLPLISNIKDDLEALTCRRMGRVLTTGLMQIQGMLPANAAPALDIVVGELNAKPTAIEQEMWLSNPTNADRLQSALKDVDKTRLRRPQGSSAADQMTFDGSTAQLSVTLEQLKDKSAQSRVACATAMLKPIDQPAVQAFAIAVANVSTRMAGLSTSIATSQLFSYSERAPRQRQVKLAVLLGESANQLAARTDALLKQVLDADQEDPNKAARKRSSAEHLRDASVTEFSSLMDWLDVTNVDNSDEGKAKNNMNGSERVTLARQLFADQYWTKINEVYSSGQGDVRMALIKDDIGNWSQKSFDNDPSKLLDAYRKVGLAALNTLAKAAQGNTVKNVELVSNLATNRFGAAEAAADVTTDLKRERDQTIAQLKQLRVDSGKLVEKYQSDQERLRGELETRTAQLALDTTESSSKRKALDEITQSYLAAISQNADQARLDELKQQQTDAQTTFTAAASQTLASQDAVDQAKRQLDAVSQPYRREMQAVMDKASHEIETLSRIANALEVSTSTRPTPKTETAP